MKPSLVALVAVLISGEALAQQSALCEDMVRYACAPGFHDDGTGTIRRGDSWSELIYKAFKNIEPKIQNQFVEVLSRAGNDDFRLLAMETFGMKDSPECNSASSVMLSACYRSVAEGLVTLVRDEITGVESRMAFHGAAASVEERQAVTRHRVFQEALAQMKKTYLGQSTHATTEKFVREIIFPRVQALLVQKIRRLPMDGEQKEALAAKVKSIRYAGSDSVCDAQAQGLAKDFLDSAYYNDAAKKFVICAGHLGKDFSEFKMVRMIGHELSHSIDPCHIRRDADGFGISYPSLKELKAAEEQYPIRGLVACLRSDKSAHAARSTSKRITFCKADQITESTADWFGSEVLADYMIQYHPELTPAQWQMGIANSVRHSCDLHEQVMNSKSKTFDEHLSLPRKLNALILTHPKIRQKMGCLPQSLSYIYCDAENPVETAKRVPATQAIDSGKKKKAKNKNPI